MIKQERKLPMRTQLTLGEFIVLLEKLSDPDEPVYFDFGNCYPSGFASYRGDYSHLALGWSHSDKNVGVPFRVGGLLAAARSVKGRTLEGWKGGTYHMTEKNASLGRQSRGDDGNRHHRYSPRGPICYPDRARIRSRCGVDLLTAGDRPSLNPLQFPEMLEEAPAEFRRLRSVCLWMYRAGWAFFGSLVVLFLLGACSTGPVVLTENLPHYVVIFHEFGPMDADFTVRVAADDKAEEVCEEHGRVAKLPARDSKCAGRHLFARYCVGYQYTYECVVNR